MGCSLARQPRKLAASKPHSAPQFAWYTSRRLFKGNRMLRKFIVLFFGFILPAAAQTIAIRAGNLIDPAKGTVGKDQIILVENGKITAVGAGLTIPKDAEVVDLSKEWVMPGLMDAHTHITFQEIPGKAPFEAMYLKEGSPFRALRGLHTGQILLKAGFTTMREVGNEADYAEIRKAIHENIYYGADVIKLAADNSDYFYTEEEIRAAADESHNAGRALAVHVYGGKAADNVIRGGADSVEHGFTLTEAQLKLMKEKGTYLVGTDFPAAHLAGLNPSNDTLADANKLGSQIIERLRNANQLGVKMAFGSDTVTEMSGRTRADMVFDYLAVWRAAGVTPADILKAMTTSCADLLRISKERGAIAPGLFADIIAMPGDPLQEIESLRKVNFVMKNGKIIRSAK